MSPRKLTDADKEELLVAYRDTAETTSTLAERYGVSSSTISRFLKSRLSTEEYEDLIQKKRLGRSNSVNKGKKSPSTETDKPKRSIRKRSSSSKSEGKGAKESSADAVETVAEATQQSKSKPKIIKKAVAETSTDEKIGDKPKIIKKASKPAATEESIQSEEKTKSNSTPKRRTRSRRSRKKVEETLPLLQELENTEHSSSGANEAEAIIEPEEKQIQEEETNLDLLALAQEISLGDRQQALKDLLGDDISEEYEEEDEEYDDEDDVSTDDSITLKSTESPVEVEILPLAEARFPRTCYVVTDKMSELIARPMKEFSDLGNIPEQETSAKTLPIFDNHRVAKRFTQGRSQKVIKVPDGQLFVKTSHCLSSRGITRILLNGNIYSLKISLK